MKISNKRVSAIDLFCGIGGLSYGLKQSGIKVLAGIDSNSSCKYAFEENIKGKFIYSDITKVSTKKLIEEHWDNDDIKILVGCAPCQPFSTHSNKIKDKENNEKWGLLNSFIEIIEKTNPLIVSMENVPNLSNKPIFSEFILKLRELGYFVSYKNVFCPDYGLAQKRRRLVLLASKLGKINLLNPTHSAKNYKTVRQAIGHLPQVKSGQVLKEDPLHKTTKLSDINLKRIKASKPKGTWEDWDRDLLLECHKKASGQSYKSVYGRMSWDEPSPTITTQFYNYGTGRFGHPSQDRALTIREAAILQSFPKNYKFHKKNDEIFITALSPQIGNAVPVILGKVIGNSIIKHLKEFI